MTKEEPMPDQVEMTRDPDAYWDLARAFVRVLMVELNDALKSSGIEDGTLRQTICARFGFGFGNFLDQYWMRAGGKIVYPLLCFSERFLNLDTNLNEIGTIHAPAEVEFHAMASGLADWYFREQQENDDAVPIGCVGSEPD